MDRACANTPVLDEPLWRAAVIEHSCAECARLLAKTVTVPEIDCVIVVDAHWTRPVNGYAYYRQTSAHRWFYQHVHGVQLPSKIDVRHTCDIRPCININHLLDGTRWRNMQDAVERNRVRHEDSHHWAKITSDVARAVVEAYQAGRDGHPGIKLTQGQVGEKFGMDQASVSRIWRGRTWYRATAEDGVRRNVPDAGRILDWDKVRSIRALAGEKSLDELSEMFGTHRDNVKKILSGQYWKDA